MSKPDYINEKPFLHQSLWFLPTLTKPTAKNWFVIIYFRLLSSRTNWDYRSLSLNRCFSSTLTAKVIERNTLWKVSVCYQCSCLETNRANRAPIHSVLWTCVEILWLALSAFRFWYFDSCLIQTSLPTDSFCGKTQ